MSALQKPSHTNNPRFLSLSLSHRCNFKNPKSKKPRNLKKQVFPFLLSFPFEGFSKTLTFSWKTKPKLLVFSFFFGCPKNTHTHPKKKKKGNRFIVWNRRKDSGFFCICGVWQGMLFTTKTVSFSWTTFLFLFHFLSHLLW